MALVTLGGVEELTANQTSEEKGVDGKSDDLKREREILHCIFLPLSVWETQSSDSVTVMMEDDYRCD